MKLKLLIIFVIVVITPLVILGWLGAKVARDERDMVRLRFRELLDERLRDVDTDILSVVQRRERELMAERNLSMRTPDTLRTLARRSPTVNHFFVLNADYQLEYPSTNHPITDSEKSFIERTSDIWFERKIGFHESEKKRQAKGKGMLVQREISKDWYVWHGENGMSALFWWRDDTGIIVGAELVRSRLMADVIAVLPDTNPNEPSLPKARIALLNEKGETMYQWGGYVATDSDTPIVEYLLSPPFSSWKLQYFASSDYLGSSYGNSVRFNVLSGMAVLVLAILGLSAYLYREYSRDLREAQQRVSFVNKVSHELKTPLTSIRMYAEMLDAELDEQNGKARKYINVIVSESQRLSRLIANVLTFGRKQRNVLRLHRVSGDIDSVLGTVVAYYEVPLAERDIKVEFTAGISEDVIFDRDALEQIVGNLLSNVEKYAGVGAKVRIKSEKHGDDALISVVDDGSGVPDVDKKKIFEPFYRVSNKLTDGVAGAGIGLAIARDLARVHGGDLTLEESECGAHFMIRLRVKERDEM